MSSPASSTQLSVSLPRNSQNGGNGQTKAPPVWAINTSTSHTVPPPLPAKCARHQDGRRGVCCKELKEDDMHLVDPDVLRDVVIGLSDGLTVPFALTAGLASLGDSRVVVLGGLAELIAGAISMGIGAFLATQAERDQYKYLYAHTSERVRQSCAGEMEREVDEILGPLGVPEPLSRQVAEALRKEELSRGVDSLIRNGHANGNGHLLPTPRASTYIPDEEQQQQDVEPPLRWSDSIGLTAFLLKFGKSLEPVPRFRMYASAFTIGMGYFVGGLIPLIPYFFVNPVSRALLYSSILTGIILVIFGAVKTHVIGANGGVRDYLWGAATTLMVGGAAAGSAYGIVKALEGSTGD